MAGRAILHRILRSRGSSPREGVGGGLPGCRADGGGEPEPAGQASYDYQGTASVGDFITISVDRVAQTIEYTNHTNGETGAATFTVAADGSYQILDPNGSLLTAYEVPGYALVVQADRTGPQADTPSLIFAILKSPLHTSDIAGGGYNFMQFRTNSGGMEVGHVEIDPLGNITTQGYWPYGSASGSPSFNGGIVCLEQSSSKTFDPACSGTYGATVYEKTGAQTGEGNQETGDVSFIRGTIVVDAAGQVAVFDEGGEELVSTALVPVEDDPGLYGPD